MVSILFTILKTAGLAALIILGLVFAVLLLILFVPVRYRGDGSYQDGLFAAKLRASWLLHMVSVRGEYQNKQALHLYLKIFGITVYDNQKASGQKLKNTKIKRTGEIQAASSTDSYPEAGSAAETYAEDIISADEEALTDSGEELAGSGGKIQGFIQKIKNFFINFVNFFKNIKFTFDRVCDTIVRIKNNIKYYLRVLQLDSTKRAFAVCQKQLVRVLEKLFPRKYRISLHLGFDDPAVTGEVLAVWGMLYPLHQGNVDILPEFEQPVMEGAFSFQGRVSVFVFVRAACILYFDKDIRRLVRHLKRSEN